jgi:peptidoglycan hydrolase-like protein with peptidoglycan-binding domain
LKLILIMKSKIFAVAASAFAFAFAFSAAAATAMPMGGVTIKAGSPSAYVMALQTNLNVCAMANPALVADGKYGPKTTAAVAAFQVANGGLTVDGQAGPLTQAALVAKCAGTTTTPSTGGSTTLSGGAGDATITSTSTDVETSVKEGESDVNVLGFQVEADGSDINVSNVKLVLSNNDYANSSEKLTDYVDTVSVFMGDKEVGSADASDFSKDSGSPDTYTKTISLSNAVVKEGKKVKFYVAFTAIDNIDSDDLTAGWDIDLDTVRYNDATGAILSDSPSAPDVTDVDFEDASTDDDLSIKSSSANPVASNITVEADNSTNDVLVGAFKFDVDDNSSDVTLNEFPVVITIDDADNTGTDPSAVIDTVTVKIDGTSYEAELDSDNLSGGDGDATYLVDLSDEDVTIDAGDQAEVKIYVAFNDQDGNYGNGTTIAASVDGSDVDAEGADDLSASGSFTGKTHTLSADVRYAEGLSVSVPGEGIVVGDEK